MYAVLNTIDAFDSHLGTVLSAHRTLEAAMRSRASIRRRHRRSNGDQFYLPLEVVVTTRRVWVGERLGPSAIVSVWAQNGDEHHEMGRRLASVG